MSVAKPVWEYDAARRKAEEMSGIFWAMLRCGEGSRGDGGEGEGDGVEDGKGDGVGAWGEFWGGDGEAGGGGAEEGGEVGTGGDTAGAPVSAGLGWGWLYSERRATGRESMSMRMVAGAPPRAGK